jgi:ribulose 1,5-bisphosphate synthetase/thiazole synthase
MTSMNFVELLTRGRSDPVIKPLEPIATEVTVAECASGGSGNGNSCFPEKTTEDLCDLVIKQHFINFGKTSDDVFNKNMLFESCISVFNKYCYVNGSIQEEIMFGDIMVQAQQKLFAEKMRLRYCY